jgi:UDP-N-acetylmuramoylalanine--D-glutamate ligase
MIEVQGKHIAVIGAARSGVAAAILLQQNGAEVFVSDFGAIDDSFQTKLTSAGIQFEEKGHTDRAKTADFVVVSPGVPTEAPIIKHHLENKTPVYSEIEVASWFADQKILATTGSNGKTTVTSWLAHIWKTGEADFSLAGNIGYAFSEKVLTAKGPHILEVSSFQLDHIHAFQPDVSVLLNITPDHLDRYENSMEKYAASKFRITENQTKENYFIYNFDDPLIKEHVESLQKIESHPQLWGFSSKNEVPEGAFIRNDHIIFRFNNIEESLMPVYDLGLPGNHNLQNGMAAALAARAGEIKNDIIRESLKSFTGVEHRLELVRIVDGVKYINDSKATNVNAVWFALDSFHVPVTLILGGRDKGNDYSELDFLLRDKVHTVIAIGESKDKIEKELGKTVPDFHKADSMNQAVRMAKKGAKRGEVVLLSPACSSFDMFEDYEHRGKVFKEEVAKL